VTGHNVRRKTLVSALASVAIVLAAAGCSGSAAGGAAKPSAKTSAKPVEVEAATVPGVGKVLVTSEGYTLYVFALDRQRFVACTGACAGTWPPLMLPDGASPAAGPGVKQSLLSSVPDPAGGRVVTYNGWPLYGYAADIQPGQATGQDIDLNGGEWYVMRVSGQPLIPSL
jgi:predicted lipoprotein with Yx(FWY)xxD motif